jgi:hypothetical protein
MQRNISRLKLSLLPILKRSLHCPATPEFPALAQLNIGSSHFIERFSNVSPLSKAIWMSDTILNFANEFGAAHCRLAFVGAEIAHVGGFLEELGSNCNRNDEIGRVFSTFVAFVGTRLGVDATIALSSLRSRS